MYLLPFLGMMLLVYPAIADTVAPTTGAVQVAPAMVAVPAALPASAAQARRVELEQRVTAWWDALIHHDFVTAYSLTSPGYRQSYSFDAFKGRFGKKSDWQRVEVVDVEFKGDDAAIVGINMHFVYHQPQTEKDLDMQTYIQESWVFVDGQWWYLVKN